MSVTPDGRLGPLEGFVSQPIRKAIDPSLHQYLPVDLVMFGFAQGTAKRVSDQVCLTVNIIIYYYCIHVDPNQSQPASPAAAQG